MLSKINRTAYLMRPMAMMQVRYFAAPIPEPLTISKLYEMGKENLSLTKIINYETVVTPGVHGLKDEVESF